MVSLPWNTSLTNPHSLPSTQFLLTQFTLTHNHFLFDYQHYIQVKRTAMAPSHINLVMGFFEQDFIHSALEKTSLWLCFIDDTFLILTSWVSSLIQFLECHYSIQFT